MSLYTTPKNSQHARSYYLNQSLLYLADQAGMTLFSLKNVNLGSSQTVFNPDGNPIADVVEITMRSSTIGTNTIDLKFYYDPYDWSFPPDLTIQGSTIKPTLSEIGLDETWDYEDPSNLNKVLGRIARAMQQDERQRVALCDNERIQVEYSCLQEMEELDCSLIPGFDGPTKVLFAVPFFAFYSKEGKRHKLKLVAKIQFLISSLVPNDVAAVQSKLEILSKFNHPEIIQSIPEIGKQEPIRSFIDRVTKKISDHFEKNDRAKILRKEFLETLIETFQSNLLECDIVNHTFASFMFSVPKDLTRPELLSTAITTFYVSDRFPEEYPKLTLTAPILPSSSFARTPPPEVIPINRYSPRWGAERIVAEIWEQLWDEIPQYHSKANQLASA